MPCDAFTNITTYGDWLVYPTSCFYYFWLVVLGVVWLVLSLTLFYNQREREIQADALSSMGVSSIAIISLALIGTLIKNSDNIPMIQQDIFLYVLSIGLALIIIWLWKKS